MALRCLRLTRLGGLGQASSGRLGVGPGASARLAEPVCIPRRFIRKENPDDVDVFGTTWQSDKYRVPHPRRLGVMPFLRPLQAVFMLGTGVVISIYFFKSRMNSYANYNLPEVLANHTDEIEQRKAIRASGWNPPSYPSRPGMLNYHYHNSRPEGLSDDPLIPSAPLLRDPGVMEAGDATVGAWTRPLYKDHAFLDMFFPEPYHRAFMFDDMNGWDRYVSRDMVKQYQAEMDNLQELAASGAFQTISQDEYDRRIGAYIAEHGSLPEDMLRLTVGGEPVWFDPSLSPAEVFQLAKEGDLSVATGESLPSDVSDTEAPADSSQKKKKKRKKKKKAKAAEETEGGNGGAGGSSSPPPPPPEEKKAGEGDAQAESPATPGLPVLPSHVTYVIIGAGTAGFSAVRGIKRNDPNARILVIGEETHRPYMRPPLSKELWMSETGGDEATAATTSTTPASGAEGSEEEAAAEPLDPDDLRFLPWSGKERSIYYEPRKYFAEPSVLKEDEKAAAVTLLTGHKVVKLDPARQRITLDTDQTLTYNRCLIATGGQPINLPAFADSSDEVKERTFVFRNIADYRRLEELTRAGKTVAVVGGGFLGSELACALSKRAQKTGGRVVQIFPESGNMAKVLPTYLSEWTTGKVRKEGVHVVTHSAVVGAKFNGSRLELETSQGESIEADNVVVAVGVRPNTGLAASARLELDENRGGFLVNSELEARSNVWVAGDASCFYDASLGRRRVEHHDHAVVSGSLAGENMTGLQKTYVHQSMFWSDLGPEVGYEAIGVCDRQLPTVAVWAKATEKDTPAAAAAASAAQDGSAMRSEAEDQSSSETKAEKPKKGKKSKNAKKSDDVTQELVQDAEKKVDPESYGKGVVFYMREKKVVGILLWNVFHRMPLARKIIADGEDHEDLSELAKKFKLHEQ